MIRAISCTEEGRIALESDDLEDLKGPFDEGLAWRNASKKWETRIWYLPALRAMTPVDLKAPGLGAQLKAAIAALKHRPAPVDPSFAFTLPARGDYQLLGMGLVHERPASMLADAVGIGKQQPVDAPVLTPTGWRKIGDLRVGDDVIGSNGKSTRVTGVFPQGVKQNYRILFSDHSSAEAGPDHLWRVFRRAKDRDIPFILTTEQILRRPKIHAKGSNGQAYIVDLKKQRALHIPLISSPVEYAPVDLPLPPYMVGALVANGSLVYQPTLSCHSFDADEVFGQIAAEGHTVTAIHRYGNATRGGISKIGPATRALGMNVHSRNKRIPPVYLLATPPQRIALLRGLMDADGSISETRNRVVYHTTSRELADDVVFLVQGLGGIASVREYDRTPEGKPVEYHVRVKMPLTICPFSTTRKGSRWKPGYKANPVRTIVSVTPTRKVESVCISVAAKDHLYVTENCVVTHNTFQSGVVLGRRCEDGGAGIIVTVLSATAQWMDEITTVYGAFEARQVILAVGTAKERRSAIAEWAKNPGGCVIITNHDTLRNDFSILRSAMEKVAKEVPTLTFIFDETGYIKNRTGSLFKASFQLGRYCTHRVALTATPIENTIGDLWAIMSWLRPAYMSRVGAFEKRHVKSFLITPPYGPPYKKIIGYKHLDEITTAIRPFYLRRTQEDAGIKMPEIDTEMVALDMTAEQERIYGAVKEDWSEGRIDPKAALVRLRMVCASPALARREASHESPKLDWLFDRVKEEPGQIVVFTESRKFAQMAIERLRRFDPVLIAGGVSPLQRRHTQRAFMMGAVRILIMTSAGERALNLQSAARLINLDFPWNPAKLQQRIGRIHRIGNPHERITVTNVVMRNSIESRVLATMVKKQRLSVAVIEGGEESVVKTLEISTATLKRLA